MTVSISLRKRLREPRRNSSSETGDFHANRQFPYETGHLVGT
jgi:hypothetical protein